MMEYPICLNLAVMSVKNLSVSAFWILFFRVREPFWKVPVSWKIDFGRYWNSIGTRKFLHFKCVFLRNWNSIECYDILTLRYNQSRLYLIVSYGLYTNGRGQYYHCRGRQRPRARLRAVKVSQPIIYIQNEETLGNVILYESY